jgi:hypothetical protein
MTRSWTTFIVGEMVFLGIAQAIGGPPWTIVAMLAFVSLSWAGPRASTLALAAPALLWLAAFRATGDRELFFPYAMHLAAVVACRAGDRGTGWALAGGGAIAAAFLGVRVWQEATARVLAVEVAVAAVVLGGAVAAIAKLPRQLAFDVAIVAAATLTAFAGLAL